MAARTPGYIRQFIGDKDVGALHPSSRFLVRRLIRCLRPEGIRTIVEFGPGPGIATRPLLDALPADARYIAIEKNPAFLASLNSSVTDPRLKVIEGDAREVREILSSQGITAVDAIISSIPFTYLTKEQRAGLIDAVSGLLADDGDFVIFHQYTPFMLAMVKKRFSRVQVLFEPRNIMPCFLIHCRKKPYS